jgi:predicted methyltransferase
LKGGWRYTSLNFHPDQATDIRSCLFGCRCKSRNGLAIPAEIERAGFKLVDSSEIEANPRDTTHWPKGVWTLPPTYRLGALDRDKYQKVGEADNFLLKFRKVE